MHKLKLVLNESNELQFDVTITVEGDDPSIDTPDVRFICESDDFEYSFRGTGYKDGTVRVTVPPMKGLMKEGQYDARLELIVNGRHFCPLEANVVFVNPMSVVAEGVRVVNSLVERNDPKIKVSAAPARSKRAKVVTESRPHKPGKAARGKARLDEMDKLLEDL